MPAPPSKPCLSELPVLVGFPRRIAALCLRRISPSRALGMSRLRRPASAIGGVEDFKLPSRNVNGKSSMNCVASSRTSLRKASEFKCPCNSLPCGWLTQIIRSAVLRRPQEHGMIRDESGHERIKLPKSAMVYEGDKFRRKLSLRDSRRYW